MKLIINKTKIILITSILAFLLSGCVSNVKRTAEFPAQTYSLSKSQKVSNVILSMTPEARSKAAKTPKFDPEHLRTQVERALRTRSLISPRISKEIPYLEIQVTKVRIRSSFTAIMFGFMAGTDSISGNVIVKSLDGKEIDKFKVSVSYALGGLGGGQDDARVNWLYEAFAKKATNELTKSKR